MAGLYVAISVSFKNTRSRCILVSCRMFRVISIPFHEIASPIFRIWHARLTIPYSRKISKALIFEDFSSSRKFYPRKHGVKHAAAPIWSYVARARSTAFFFKWSNIKITCADHVFLIKINMASTSFAWLSVVVKKGPLKSILQPGSLTTWKNLEKTRF